MLYASELELNIHSMLVVSAQLFFWVDYPYKEINPGNMLLDKNGHMQLSHICLCKPIDCSKLSTLNENDSMTIDWVAHASSRTKQFFSSNLMLN
jgi:hypothetical protein